MFKWIEIALEVSFIITFRLIYKNNFSLSLQHGHFQHICLSFELIPVSENDRGANNWDKKYNVNLLSAY